MYKQSQQPVAAEYFESLPPYPAPYGVMSVIAMLRQLSTPDVIWTRNVPQT
jgi:hypothetical protein